MGVLLMEPQSCLRLYASVCGEGRNGHPTQEVVIRYSLGGHVTALSGYCPSGGWP